VKVVVTGAGGFVGERVALHLAAEGFAVAACYRTHLPASLRVTHGIELLQGDLARDLPLPAAFDAVVHCAADIPGLCPDPAQLTRSNVGGAERLLGAMRAAGARAIVNLSSMSVYGKIAVPVVTEDLRPEQPDPYGESKLATERMIAALCAETGLSALSIRLPGTVGRGSHHNFLSTVMGKILSGEPIRANNPEAPFNNIVYVGDLCVFIADWLSRALAGAVAGHAVTNLAAREPLAVRDVIGTLYRVSGKPPAVTFADEGKAPFLIDLTRALSLGYRAPTVRDSLESFARDCVQPVGVQA
jgi:nucleoside-diphosphate-sugar epimerase